MSDDTDDDVLSVTPSSRPKSNYRIISDSSPSTDTSPILSTKRKTINRNRIVSEDSDSDSTTSGSSIVRLKKRKKVAPLSSDSEDDSDSSDSVIIRRVKKRASNVIKSDDEDQGFKGSSSQWESDDDSDAAGATAATAKKRSNDDRNVESDSSDGQSEKCPICLVPIRSQELGTPESCDHLFCVECILEWSKTMNTCPVDRQEYRLILVRKKIEGKIVRRIPVEKPAPPEAPQEDQTCCEICGSGEREDRLLLCDGCDLGFHLECLTPPLEEVPHGSWYCNECDPHAGAESEGDLMQIHYLLESEFMTHSIARRRTRSTARLIPRTGQSERVISRIMHNRTAREDAEEPTSSTQTTAAPAVKKKRKNKSSKRPKKNSRKSLKKYRTVYEIDEDTGEIISKRKQVNVKRKRKKKKQKQNRPVSQPKTVKKRLAKHLGMCAMKQPSQSLPDVKIQHTDSSINNQRYQAGIPTLHLFGQRDNLDYFSASEEDIGGSDYLVRRRPNQSDAVQFRRAARRKAVLLSPPHTVSSTSDLLGSIIDSQTKLYSKNTTFSVDNSGKFRMENQKEGTDNSLDLKDFNKLTKKTPYGGNNHNNGRRYNSQPYSNNSYQNNSSYYAYDNFGPSSTSEQYMSFSGPHRGPNNYDQDMPQDYTQSTLSSYDREPYYENQRRYDRRGGEGGEEEDSDIDIYSDIEDSVSTSRAEETMPLRPLNLSPGAAPAMAPSNGSDVDNENNDSDTDMVIDTDKVEPPVEEEGGVSKEETAVTSSEDTVTKCKATSDVASVPHSTTELQSEAVQSTISKNKDLSYEDEDAYSEDGCPNFSIYSTESINLAKNTDVGLSAEDNADQNSQVASTTLPLPEPPRPQIDGFDPDEFYDPEMAYDPEAAYNSDKEESEPRARDSEPDDAYDPELVCDTPEDAYDPEKTFDAEDSGGNGNVASTKMEVDGPCKSSTPVEEAIAASRESEKSTEQDVDTSAQHTTPNDDAPALDTKSDSDDPDEDKQITEVDKLTNDEDEPSSEKDANAGDDDKGKRLGGAVTKGERKEHSKLNLNALYSDSEDEDVVKISKNNFIVGDISTMTEDVSEEERSYTPCLDERAASEKGKGPDGLDTEMISDDEKNDFDESHEQKTASEGDALEINAKEFEMDMIRPEDYEEGEIVDKNKTNQEATREKDSEETAKGPEEEEEPLLNESNEQEKEGESNENKENEPREKQPFKKLSKNNKERSYRDQDGVKSKEKRDNKTKERENTKGKKRDKRKEIERYDVRALIAEKPRRMKDKFGRDVRQSASKSKSRSRSKSLTPKQSSPVSQRRSVTREDKRKKRSGSLRRRSPSKSRSRSRQRKRPVSRTRRRRSASRSKRKRKTSKDRLKRKKRRSTSRTYTPVRKRRKDWEERFSREGVYSGEERWTPSLSRTPDIEPPRHASPSWTPPRIESAAVDPRGLTVILQNDQNKKKKERKKKGTKRREPDKRPKRRRRDQTPPPSKEVFASGDNILVSVSFNKETETRERDVFTRKKKESDDRERRRRFLRRKKKNQELAGVKPVAIIDLERSPFRELTPSPRDVIILSDEEHAENNNIIDSQDMCDSSQQVASPENVQVYMTGPKTPPEPQIKFMLPSKQLPMRPLLINPLHDPEDEIQHEQEEQIREICDLSEVHIGPNTPPEPPNSPPSSPDAYDPFEPTKSRSPTPDRAEVTVIEEEPRNLSDHLDKVTSIPAQKSPVADVQPADSQSSLIISRDSSKSPEQLGRPLQPSITKSTAQSVPFSSSSVTVTSTPVSSNSVAPRINILNSTVLSNISTALPQRIVLPNVKLSPVKISPVKTAAVKSTPIKPMPNKNASVAVAPNKSKAKGGQQNGNDSTEVISLDFDSPYSPGSSDYEDLFEPPPEVVTKKSLSKSAPSVPKDTGGSKVKNAFDALFGSPMKKMSNTDKLKTKKGKGTKIVGVKLDEDHLKILDELPNSAVEMQVKDKFLKKLNRQERVVEEVKLVLKPYYNKKKIDKEEYKDIMRRAVPKICHNKSGEINPTRIKNLIEAYVRKMRHSKPKVTSSSSYNPLKG